MQVSHFVGRKIWTLWKLISLRQCSAHIDAADTDFFLLCNHPIYQLFLMRPIIRLLAHRIPHHMYSCFTWSGVSRLISFSRDCRFLKGMRAECWWCEEMMEWSVTAEAPITAVWVWPCIRINNGISPDCCVVKVYSGSLGIFGLETQIVV